MGFDALSRPAKRLDDAGSGHVGTWTAMGLVKRLDDQKRLIDRMRQELDQVKATKRLDSTTAAEIQKIAELVEVLETALTTNKRLADSVIRIREKLYEIIQENQKLRKDVDVLKTRSLMAPVQRSVLSAGALGVVKTLTAGPKSATEISHIVEHSREHTSRTVKRLLDLGLLERAGKTFPAKYVLTELARQLLRSETVSTSE